MERFNLKLYLSILAFFPPKIDSIGSKIISNSTSPNSFLSRRTRLNRWIPLAIALSIGIAPFPARAAERVVLKYGLLQAPVSVADLTRLAETGEVSLALAAYLRLANRNPEELRRVLNQGVPVKGRLLESLLDSVAGQFLLDRAGEIVGSPDNAENHQALRSAIVNSALPDDRVTPLEILQNYPERDLHVNGDRLVEIAQSLRNAANNLPNLPLPF
ncbi:MAG: alpha/beta hydrolase [Cyanobacteriota bacterium]|nr:alpha/beta hydrolase [Cyanobacteriota bacterium]